MDRNNCGYDGVSRRIKPPYWALFNADCGIHDANYEQGGGRGDKLKADVGFLRRMIEDCNQIEDYYRKRKAVRMAIVYYIAVRLFGFISWNKK